MSKINYLLRPNKNIQRKLIVECLCALNEVFSLKDYMYIGFGGMWFVDFILVHKRLRIKKMFSIEKTKNAQRAEFNKPYRCITLKAGDSSEVLPDLDLESSRVIVWLDYEKGLEKPVLDDVRLVCEKSRSGSIFLATLNANFIKLGKYGKRIHALRQCAGDLVSPGLKEKDVKKTNYPQLLAEILLAHIQSVIRDSGRSERFYALFNIFYKDTSPMLTIGGMIANKEDKKMLDSCDLTNRLIWVKGKKQFQVKVPHLTIKEKITLDAMLPKAKSLQVKEIQAKSLPLDRRDIKAYCDFYQYYPVFGEFSF